MKIVYLLGVCIAYATCTNAQVPQQPLDSIEAPGYQTPDMPVAADNSGPFTICEDPMPTFPGGEAAFINFLKKNVLYPDAVSRQMIRGTVKVRFNIETDGSVTDPKVLQSPNLILSIEALRVVCLMPKWVIPRSVHSTWLFTLPIRFTL